MSEKILLKKYTNRRLYDTEQSKYVTLSEVAELIRADQQGKLSMRKPRRMSPPLSLLKRPKKVLYTLTRFNPFSKSFQNHQNQPATKKNLKQAESLLKPGGKVISIKNPFPLFIVIVAKIYRFLNPN